MARCMICNYSPDVEGYTSDNYMEEGYDLCVKCNNQVSDALYELELVDEINAEVPTEAVQTDLEYILGKSDQEKEEASLAFLLDESFDDQDTSTM